MFSSNQQLKISCDKSQIKDALEFVLNMDNPKSDSSKKNLCYQVAKDNQRIAIGWYFKTLEPGWTAFPFKNPSIELLTATVIQFCEERPDNVQELFDGSYHQGYLIQAAPESMAEEQDGIVNPFYALFTVQSYKLFYAK